MHRNAGLARFVSLIALTAMTGACEYGDGSARIYPSGGLRSPGTPSEGTGGSAGMPGSAGAPDDAGTGSAGMPGSAGAPDDGAAGEGSATYGGLVVSTTPDKQAIDVFGVAGHRFWIEVSEEQLELMNGTDGGFPIFEAAPLAQNGDIYTPGNAATYADHVVVEDFETKSVADYGKLEVWLVGESTHRPWDRVNIPNVRIDADEFQDGMRIGDVEHLRLNNSLVGTIFREHVAHRIYTELGYPALRSTFAFLGSNVWGEDIWVPMTLIEVYKCKIFEDRPETLGGSCVNMWEFAGDIQFLDPLPPDACQNHECDDTRLLELIDLAAATPAGEGFEEALADYIDWDYYHRFQCLSWILSTGDDAVHSGNNNLIIERDDGRLVWAPYSIDISAGQEWYPTTPLIADTVLARGCQTDPACWADTVAACEALIEDFRELKPETIVDETEQLLSDLGMLREGDEARAEALRDWYLERQTQLQDELEIYRYLPDAFGNCPDGLEACNDNTCGTSEQCEERQCQQGQQWCEAYGYCIDPMWDYCPACEEAAPLWCAILGQCVESVDVCSQACLDQVGLPYCELFHDCRSPEQCFDGPIEPLPPLIPLYAVAPAEEL